VQRLLGLGQEENNRITLTKTRAFTTGICPTKKKMQYKPFEEKAGVDVAMKTWQKREDETLGRIGGKPIGSGVYRDLRTYFARQLYPNTLEKGGDLVIGGRARC